MSSKMAIAGCTVAVLLSVVFPEPASADWDLYPVLRLGVDYDDNATLTTKTDDELTELTGYIGEVRLGALYTSPKSLFYVEPVVRARRYEEENFDSNDAFLNFRMQRTGTSYMLGMRGSYSREAVRTAELADVDLESDTDPDEIEDDDTGQVELRQRREKLRLVPRWKYQFSDISSIVTDLNAVTVNFEDDENLVFRLTDYTDVRARIAYERAVSDRNTGILLATARNYQTDFLDGDFSGFGVSAGFRRKLTETSNFHALFGVEKADQLGPENGDPHFVTDISLVRYQETTRLLLQYRRRIAASGRGSLAVRNEVYLRFTRDLAEKFTAGIGARAYESTRLGVVENETRYVQLNAQVLWRLTSAFSLQASYRHSIIDRSAVGESANSNRVTVWFNYQPNSRAQILYFGR